MKRGFRITEPAFTLLSHRYLFIHFTNNNSMKKIFSILTATIPLAGLTVLAGGMATGSFKADPESASGNAGQTLCRQTGNAVQTSALPPEAIHCPAAASPLRTAPLRAPLAESDYTGDWIHTFVSLTSNMGNGGGASKITPVAGTDSVEISNLWIASARVRAKIDRETGRLSIPSQIAFTDPNYGKIMIAASTESGTPDKSRDITGTVTPTGISIPDMFGMFVTEGADAGGFLGVAHDVSFFRPNATMTCTSQAGTTVTYGVFAEQKSDNSILIRNFGNFGHDINVTLFRDRSAMIAQQVVREDAAGSWLTIGSPTLDNGKLSFYTGITVKEGDSPRTMEIESWSMYAKDKSLVGTIYTGASIQLPFDMKFPGLTVNQFTGSGTADDPYLISTLDELVLMADSVNNNHNFIYPTTNDTPNVSRTFIGKHFRMTKDIDMAGYTFEPIGHDYRHRFEGTFDGDGHTIRNLNVNTGIMGYAGLFGYTDSLSVIRNVRFEKPVVRTSAFACGVAAAYSLGTVSGVHVDQPDVQSTSQVVGGLVGNGFIVEDCSVSGGRISCGQGLVGGMAGQVRKSISRSWARDTEVIGSCPTDGAIGGGLIGSLFVATASDCWFTGIVDSYSSQTSMYLGGIAGVCFNGRLERCFSAARILGWGQLSKNGGVVGYHMGDMTDCYSAGTVQCASSYNTGGIAGTVERYQLENGAWREASVRNCYTTVALTAEKSYYDPAAEFRETIGRVSGGSKPTIENIYFNRQMCDFKSEKYGSTTAQLTSAQGPAGFDSRTWLFTQGQYPRLRSLESAPGSDFSASVIDFGEGSSIESASRNAALRPLGATEFNFVCNGKISKQGHYSSIDGDTLRINENLSIGTDTLLMTNGETSIIYMVKIAPRFLDGEGTAESPYLIRTKEDLITLAEAVSLKNQLFAGTYFDFTADIDMEYDERFRGIATGKSTSNKFSGIIDGKGHSIRRMRNHRFEWKVRPEDSKDGWGTPSTSVSDPDGLPNFAGLIGRLAVDGAVRNLTIEADNDLVAFASNGAFVGENSGTIENCVNHADVKTFSMRAAGIAAQNTATGKISRCLNTGNIQTGYNIAGGIAGINQGLVEQCANTGRVEAIQLSTFQTATSGNLKYAGGIAGQLTSGKLHDVVNYGTIHTRSSNAGGICGNISGSNIEIDGAMNFGMVSTPNLTTIGAIAAATGAFKTVNACWDASLLPIKAAANSDVAGMNPMSVNALTAGSAIEGFKADLWDFQSGLYPTLKAFAATPDVRQARAVVAFFPEGSSAYSVKGDVPLSSGDGLSWRLAQGKSFSIEGNTLKPESVTEAVSDTLIAAFGNGLTKEILLKANPPIPLKGEGSQSDPYTISSADEWNSLAGWIGTSGETLSGKFVSLTADIDFGGKPMIPLAADGVTSFAATFLGNGKTVSNATLATTSDYQGPFGTISAEGSVSDVTFDITLTSAHLYTGGVAGRLYGKMTRVASLSKVSSSKNFTAGIAALAGEGAELRECVNKGTVSASAAATNTAGICASAEAGCLFDRCGNEGTVSNTGTGLYTAGVVATSLPSTFTGCYNSGKVEVTNPATKNLAGVIAFANGNAKTTDPYIIRGCWNSSDLAAYSKVSGVVGMAGTAAGGAKLLVDSCWNSGAIRTLAEKTDASAPTTGIVGQYTAGSKITNCRNDGDITSTMHLNVAGIAGISASNPTAAMPAEISGCVNNGHITATNSQGAGIVAILGAYLTVRDCHNHGDVSGGSNLGGIAATWSGNGSLMEDCSNTASIAGDKYRIGGLVGQSSAGTATLPSHVNRCWNTGDVSTSSEIQGVTTTAAAPAGFAIGGLAGTSKSVFTDCFNAGSVKGVSQTGGLVGQPVKAFTSFENCYNIGRIIAPADTCGNIVGVNTANGKIWSEDNTVKNVWYLEENRMGSNDVIGEPTTTARLCQLDMGPNWRSTDDYTLPLVAGHERHPHAAITAAQLILAEGDTPEKVTKPFHVGLPGETEWSVDVSGIDFDGNEARFKATYSGKAVVTARCGTLTRTHELTLDVVSGVGTIDASGDVAERIFFTPAGLRVDKPAEKDGKVYIVLVRYRDGRMATFKLLNR